MTTLQNDFQTTQNKPREDLGKEHACIRKCIAHAQHVETPQGYSQGSQAPLKFSLTRSSSSLGSWAVSYLGNEQRPSLFYQNVLKCDFKKW